MSKYNAFIVILVALVLQSCSDESKSTDCSQCAQNTQCETCKEGDECPACNCKECVQCKEGDECPACNCKECETCKECPECNTDALNSQLTSCNNELATTKQALKTEQNANESCVGDLDTCNKDLSELSAKPRSKSGSRLIFKEHKMSDGSIYVEPYPYDTKLNIACNFTTTEFGQCCVPSNAFTDWDISASSFQNLYKDDNCATSLSSLSQEELYRITANNCAKIGDVVFTRGSYNYCASEYSVPSAYKIKSVFIMYKKQNESCVQANNYPLLELEPISLSEVKSHYVCEE